MGLPYSWVNTWVNTRCANSGKTYTIPIPIPMAATILGLERYLSATMHNWVLVNSYFCQLVLIPTRTLFSHTLFFPSQL